MGDLGFTVTPTSITYPSWWNALGIPTSLSGWISPINQVSGIGANAVNGMQLSGWSSLGYAMAPKAAGAAAATLPNIGNMVNPFPALGGFNLGGGLGGAPVSAGLGNAGSIGALSVPQAWAGGAGSAVSPATALPITGVSGAPEAAPGGSMLGGVPFMGGAGRGFGGPGPRYGFQLSVVPHPPSAG
jgi:hypothetical protein